MTPTSEEVRALIERCRTTYTLTYALCPACGPPQIRHGVFYFCPDFAKMLAVALEALEAQRDLALWLLAEYREWARLDYWDRQIEQAEAQRDALADALHKLDNMTSKGNIVARDEINAEVRRVLAEHGLEKP